MNQKATLFGHSIMQCVPWFTHLGYSYQVCEREVLPGSPQGPRRRGSPLLCFKGCHSCSMVWEQSQCIEVFTSLQSHHRSRLSLLASFPSQRVHVVSQHSYLRQPPGAVPDRCIQSRMALCVPIVDGRTSGNWQGFGIPRQIWSTINTLQSVDKILFGLNTS